MVKKRSKSTKKLRKRAGSWTEEDVKASTSLPPQVEGQLRCYLKLSITQILWLIPSPPEVTHARIKWWGETGEGTLFRPVDVKNKVKGVSRTTARFPIRSGPKQFAAYLNDMNGLIIEILSGPSLIPVARVQIDHIGTLAPNRPINGFFPVFSADSEKVAELQVSIVLESLMASYDSQSSVPTTDMSVDIHGESADHQSGNPQRAVPQPRPSLYGSADVPFQSPVTHQAFDQPGYGQVETSTSNPSYPHSSRQDENLRNTMDSNASTLKGISSLQSEALSSGVEDKIVSGSSVEKKMYSGWDSSDLKGGASSGTSVDIVSALIEKGSKLREAMIISTLDSHNVDRNDYMMPVNPLTHKESSKGDLFREILKPAPEVDPDKADVISTADVEHTTLDLIVDNHITDSEFKLLKGIDGNAASSISGDDAMLLESDIDDPIHDDEILGELFYKHDSGESDDLLSEIDDVSPPIRRSRSCNSLSSLDDPGNARPPSRLSSGSSMALDREPVRESDPVPVRSRSRTKAKLKKLKSNAGKESQSRSRSTSRERKKKKTNKKKASSENDLLKSPRISESGSRVSYSPATSDRGHRSSVCMPRDGLSIERLTLLGRVHVARVMVDSYTLSEDPALETPSSTPRSRARASRGKPPRPHTPKTKYTYFVEYQFPVVAASRGRRQPSAAATEVMRVVSKKVSDNVVSFGHRSVFPVMFDGDAIEKWWKSAVIFKVYSKTAGQKVPRLLGMASVPLKSVLKSESLFIDRSVEVKDRSTALNQSDSSHTGHDGLWPVVGNLKLSIELASDHKDFSAALAKTRLAEMSNPKIIPIPPTRPKSRSPQRKTSRERTLKDAAAAAGTQTEPQTTNIHTLPMPPPPEPRVPQPQLNYQQGDLPTTSTESLTLHTLLFVPEGMNITLQGTPVIRHGERIPSQTPKSISSWTGRDMATRNLYLVSRMFWCDDITRSGVCWGTFDPQFNFTQVAPILLTVSLLERMRNNFMVLEVWDKKTTAENDQLVGIVKLPLHQFYMSYRDRRIATSLLRSQYPVISVDNEIPIVSPFCGKEYGKLKVLLAMGSMEQVSSLQKMKNGQPSAIAAVTRPDHYLERYNVYGEGQQQEVYTAQDNIVEHVFEVCIEAVKGLQLLENMIWGEADCFIQYHFPVQKQQHGSSSILPGTPTLQTFRTATTLCIPDPVFNDVLRHRITLPEGTPVQREILTACAGVGGGAGGIPFEVWCRYYYPNVRDQVIAKGLLPLAKLCAMVTMQRRGEQSIQTYTITLTNLTPEADQQESNAANKLPECGLLEVTINYKSSVHRAQCEKSAEPMTRSLPTATVCLAVSIIRASGLKAAAKALAKHDSSMQYVSEVGVNTYIRVKLSFLQKEDERLTRTVARTFAPEFGYHLDFPCPLLWTEVGCDALSLAEILESGEAVFELWHQAPRSPFDAEAGVRNTGSNEVRGRRLISLAGDVLLGTVTVPLLGLLTKKTGISGWFSVTLPSLGWDQTQPDGDFSQSEEGHHGNRGLERVVGGLELAIKFAHHEDLTRVVDAARGVGWAPDFDVEHRDWESADELLDHFHQITISVDLCIFPLQNALVTGQTKLDTAARCYVRYKFYDKGAVCSRVSVLEPNDDNYVTADLQHSKTLIVAGSSPFSWYLREEHLEVQIWVTYNMEGSQKQRPRNRDKLIGSAYIDMTSLADSRRRQHRVSGVYPLFKPGASSLGGACIRAHVSLKPHTGELIDSDDSELDVDTNKQVRHVRSPVKKSSPVKQPEVIVDLSDTFPVHIVIERAFHLPNVIENSTSSVPSSYVSYQTADQSDLSCTEICHNSNNPVWNHTHDTRLSNDLLLQGTKNLVFKVWHKPSGVSSVHDKSVDKVLGFVSVDLSPLLTGFSQISGWYNIMDFSGQCQGQIKISVIPQQHVTSLKPSDMKLTAATSSSSSTCQSYITQAVYPHFPSHLTWYPEQQISKSSKTAPDTNESGNLPHFAEHFNNVKKHHEQLHEMMQQMGINDPNTASRSILFNQLRNNLEELDLITHHLKQKLYQSKAPSSATAEQPQENGYACMTFTSMTDMPTTVSSLRPPSDTEELCGNTDQVVISKPLESTGHTQGYEAGTEDNGISTFSTQQELLSTQGTMPNSEMIGDTERSENDQTLFSATLEQAQQMLRAIHEAQEKYSNQENYNHQEYSHPENYSNQGTTSLGTASVPTGDTKLTDRDTEYMGDLNNFQTGSSLGDTALQDQQYGYTENFDQQLNEMQMTYDVPNASGGKEQSDQNSDVEGKEAYVDDAEEHEHIEEEHEEEWEEEDTFSKAWAARQSDRQSDILSEISVEEEDVVIMQKPLNDISSATFLNGYDDSFRETDNNGMLNSEESTRPIGVKPVSSGTTQNTDDTFFASHDTAWQGQLTTGENLGTLEKTSMDDEQQNEFHESCPSMESGGRTGEELHEARDDAGHEEYSVQVRDVLDTPPTSASSRSTGGRNGRKAAMIRREHERCHISQSSSSDDDRPVIRTPSKRKHHKALNHGDPSASQARNGIQASVRPNGVNGMNGVNGEDTEGRDGHVSMETGLELNGDRDTICDEDETQLQKSTREPKQVENGGVIMPNFFLPPEDLAQSLRMVTTSARSTQRKHKNDSERLNGNFDPENAYQSSTNQVKNIRGMGHQQNKPTSLPSQEQVQRIAKIFAQKFS